MQNVRVHVCHDLPLMYERPAGTRGNICSRVVPAVRAIFIKVRECNDPDSYIFCFMKECRCFPINIKNTMLQTVQINSLKSCFFATALTLSMQGSRGDDSL